MTEGKRVSRSSSFLQSMVNRLAPKEKVQPSGQRTSKWYSDPEDIRLSEDEVVGETSQLESNFAGGDVPFDSHGLDGTFRDEDSRTSTQGIDGEEPNSSPTTFPRWERRKLTSNDLMKKLEDLQSSKRGNLRETQGLEEEPCRAESCFKDSSSQEVPGSSTHGPNPTPSPRFRKETKKAPRTPPPKPPRTKKFNLNLHNEGENGGQEPSNTDERSCKPFEEPGIRQTRSASDPVTSNTRSERFLSVPSRCSADMDQDNEVQVQAAMLKAELTALDSASKRQNKVKKEQKTKNKLKIRQKEKKRDDEEAQSVSSVEAAESPTTSQSSPPISLEEENPTTVHIRLQRTFTLRDFSLDLEPINLLEEVLTGEEWVKFLPAKESPPIPEDTSGPSQTESSCQSEEVQAMRQDPPGDREPSQSEEPQVSFSDGPSEEVRQSGRRQGGPSSIIFALPKALISNGAVKQRKPEVPPCGSSDDNVYDFVKVYMLPKDDASNNDPPLDLSAVKSLGVLDNSALKSRIHLSKKRKSRPPKRKKQGEKEKSGPRPASVFYTSGMDLPPRSSTSPSSSVKSVTTSPSSAFSSSVFYMNLAAVSSPCDSDALPTSPPAEEKQNTSEKATKSKPRKLKT